MNRRYNAELCFVGVSAVSYTHLDVYKRQINKQIKKKKLYMGK